MNAEYNRIIQSLKMRQYAPFYLIDGEEPYYIDLLTEHFENDILLPHEKDFNLITLYGKDVAWADVVNACRRFPMFAEKQVVILKDAASLKDFASLMGYFEKPSPTTVLLIEYRFKKADGKTKAVKYAKDKGLYFNSEKIKDASMPAWIRDYGKEVGFTIGERESEILATYLGNDLQKVVNEISKVRINVPDEKELTAAMIQKYIGISREYNIFEFPDVLTGKDMDKLYRMLNYFLNSPKAAPMPLLIGSFYSHFSKLYMATFLVGKPEKDIIAALGYYKLKETMAAVQIWPRARVERALMLLGKYSTMAVGIKSNNDDKELLKELIGQLLN
ncbi:DNA polymerase III subunit delta [Flavipsychrobacter stenotrophus]|uniref:DNA polymerase III subunit delta n=1 Tax=Flavipsychrobacter stenotrophus TaxID=2077091 RepID=A0A2S7ST22_9BACT|nr:DNA polymerase III subunit delta [Flavipsychrobacter stenotrophus]PQJ09848.1 DNA polymerase III subunit delta [Flavipsychrobacter stenotrophus]